MARTISILVGVLLSVACASAPVQRADDGPTADQADVRVTSLRAPVVVRVGQTLGLHTPRSGVQWQVSYDTESLRLLTPVDELAAPGPRGWVWRGIKVGQSELVLTSRAKCDAPPCPPNVMEITLQVDVKPATD